MSWCDLTHAELLEGLRFLLAQSPLPPPRVRYATPDGRERLRLPQARQGTTRNGPHEPSEGVAGNQHPSGRLGTPPRVVPHCSRLRQVTQEPAALGQEIPTPVGGNLAAGSHSQTGEA